MAVNPGRQNAIGRRNSGCTLRRLCNAFLAAKERRTESGELSRQSFAEYHATCAMLIESSGRERRVDDLCRRLRAVSG